MLHSVAAVAGLVVRLPRLLLLTVPLLQLLLQRAEGVDAVDADAVRPPLTPLRHLPPAARPRAEEAGEPVVSRSKVYRS